MSCGVPVVTLAQDDLHPELELAEEADEAKELTEEQQERQNRLKQDAAEALEEGDKDRALCKLTEAISIGRPSALMHSRRAEIFLGYNNPQEAINDCNAALAINPDSGKAFKIRAQAHVRLEQWLDARADFQEALKIDYDEVAYQECQQVEEKIKESQPAPAVISTAISVQMWEITGGEDKGGVLVRDGLEISSPQAGARLSFGALVQQLDLVDDRLHYRKVKGSGPEEGWISVALKDKVLAVRTTSEDIEVETEDAAATEPPFPAMSPADVQELTEELQDQQNALKQKSADALEDGDAQLALDTLTEAIVLGCAGALMYCRRAQMLLQLDRPHATINDCGAALDINPDSGKAFKIRARAYVKLKRWRNAHSDFQEGLKIDYDEGTYEESLDVAARAKEIKGTETANRVKGEDAALQRRKREAEAQQRKFQEEQRAREAAAVAAANKPLTREEKIQKRTDAILAKVPGGAQGNGYTKCFVCGWRAADERSKQAHGAIQGHAGFFDANGNLPQYIIESKGGG